MIFKSREQYKYWRSNLFISTCKHVSNSKAFSFVTVFKLKIVSKKNNYTSSFSVKKKWEKMYAKFVFKNCFPQTEGCTKIEAL